MTGVNTDIEQALSSIYIEPIALSNIETTMPTYGTRTQSILTVSYDSKSSILPATYHLQLDSREYQNIH